MSLTQQFVDTYPGLAKSKGNRRVSPWSATRPSKHVMKPSKPAMKTPNPVVKPPKRRGAWNVEKPHVYILRPPVLATRLTNLCDEKRYDEAVTMLKNAPRDAQNTVVWNTLIAGVMKASKFQLGYQLYIEVCCVLQL